MGNRKVSCGCGGRILFHCTNSETMTTKTVWYYHYIAKLAKEKKHGSYNNLYITNTKFKL